MNKHLYLLFLFFAPFLGFSQTSSSQFRTNADGDWNNSANWQYRNSSRDTWQPSPIAPTATTAGTITVRNSITVTSSNLAIDQTTVTSTGTITISSGATLEIANDGSAVVDLNALNGKVDVYGTLQLNEGATTSETTSAPYSITFYDGSLYSHNYTVTNGAIPSADWQTGSTTQIVGYTSVGFSGPTNAFQTFYNVVWNTPNFAPTEGVMDLDGGFKSILGDFLIQDTNGNLLSISDAVNYTLNVSGDLEVTGNSLVSFSYSQSSIQVDIGGNFLISSTAELGLTDDASAIYNIAGNFEVNNSAANINLVQDFSAGSPETFNINLEGDLILTAGQITQSDLSLSPNFNFAGTSITQNLTIDPAFTISPTVNFVVEENADVDFQESVLTGTHNFDAQNNSTLRFGSLDAGGAFQSGTSGGNLQLSGTRSFGTDVEVIFNGDAAQVTGDGFTAAQSSGSLDLIVDNLNGVSLNADLSIQEDRLLSLTNGSLTLGDYALTVNGQIEYTNGAFNPSANSALVIGASSNPISSQPDFVLPFASASPEIGTLTINRDDQLDLGADLTVASLLNLSDGNLALNENTLILTGDLSVGSGEFVVTAADTLVIAGSGPLSSGLAFFSISNTIGQLEINREGGSVSLANGLGINDDLLLTAGDFTSANNLIIVDGSRITRNAGTIDVTPDITGQYEVWYTGEVTTGPELPAAGSGNLSVLRVESTGTVTLADDVSMTGNLELESGTLDAGNFSLSIGNNFVSNSSLNPGGSTVVFTGTGEINGTVVPTFNNITFESGADISLSGISMLQVAGNWNNNGGTFTAGSTVVEFTGADQALDTEGQPFADVSMAGSGTKTLGSDLDINGVLSFGEGVTLNLDVYTLFLESDWDGTGGNILNTAGTVNLDGAAQSITSGEGSFGNLILAGTGTKTLQDALDVDGNLTIEADLDPNGQDVNLAGNWINNGSFSQGTSTVFFDGTSAQTIAGSNPTSWNNLTVSNSAGVTALTDQSLFGVLTVDNSGVLNPDGTDGSVNFVLESTGVSQTAAVADLSNGTINGAMVVERYVHNTSNAVYRYFTTPVVGAVLGDWTDDIAVRGNFTGAEYSGGATMYSYNESVAGTANDGWEAFPGSGGSLSTSLEVGRGYAAGVQADSSVVLEVKGPINQGSFSGFNLSYTDNGAAADIGWNLIGNPYPSAIDWSALYNGSTNISTTAAIPVNSATDLSYTYLSAVVPVPVNGSGRNIASGQGFWVQAIGESPTLTAQESIKVSDANPAYQRTGAVEDVLLIRLENEQYSDETVLVLRDDASMSYEAGRDGNKLPNYKMNLSTLSEEGNALVYNFWPLETCDDYVRLNVDVANIGTGSYSMGFDYVESINSQTSLELIDNYAGTVTPVTANTVYTFEVTEDVASTGSERFAIRTIHNPLDLNLAMESQAVCVNAAPEVVLSNTQEGVFYQAYLNGQAIGEEAVGNGAELNILLPAASFEAGTHEVTFEARKAECTPQSLLNTALVTVNPIAEVTGVEGGSSCGAGAVTLIAKGAQEGDLYQWFTSADAIEPVFESSANSFTVEDLQATTYYHVGILNASGCASEERIKVAAVVNPLPEITQATAAEDVCAGSTGTLQAEGAPADGFYRWMNAAGEVLAETTEGTYATSALTESVSFKVQAVSAEGCESAVTDIQVSVQELEQPVISEIDGMLSVSMTEGIQWYFNGELIEEATSALYEPGEAGNYSVSHTNGNCTVFSEEFVYAINGMEDELAKKGIKLYPNPVIGNNFRLDIQKPTSVQVEVSIFTIEGKEVTLPYRKEVSSSGAISFTFDAELLKQNVYLVKIIDQESTYLLRIVKP